MKITKSQLKQIIKEELGKILSEDEGPIKGLSNVPGLRGLDSDPHRTPVKGDADTARYNLGRDHPRNISQADLVDQMLKLQSDDWGGQLAGQDRSRLDVLAKELETRKANPEPWHSRPGATWYNPYGAK